MEAAYRCVRLSPFFAFIYLFFLVTVVAAAMCGVWSCTCIWRILGVSASGNLGRELLHLRSYQAAQNLKALRKSKCRFFEILGFEDHTFKYSCLNFTLHPASESLKLLTSQNCTRDLYWNKEWNPHLPITGSVFPMYLAWSICFSSR